MPLHTYKVVLNSRYGGFSVSRECAKELSSVCSHHTYLEEGELQDLHEHEEYRECPDLVARVESAPEWASGPYSKLRVEEVLLRYGIKDHDGKEEVYYGY